MSLHRKCSKDHQLEGVFFLGGGYPFKSQPKTPLGKKGLERFQTSKVNTNNKYICIYRYITVYLYVYIYICFRGVCLFVGRYYLDTNACCV